MKCPNCGYEHGWSGEALDDIPGEHGPFYELPVKVERRELYSYHTDADRRYLYACPKCKMAFIE